MTGFPHDARHHLAARHSVLPLLRGPRGGAHPACRRRRDRARHRRDQRPDQPVERALLQRAAGPQLGRVRHAASDLLRAGRQLHRARGLPALSQPMAPDPLAALHDDALPRRLARRRQPLPHAACRRRRRQPGPAHRRGRAPIHRRRIERRRNPADRPRPAQCRRDARLLRRDPLGAFGSGAADALRVDDSRLPGLGRADLRGRRHAADASDRPAADRAEFQPAALRGRFPLQPRSHARELRADRAAARRDGRTRAPDGPLRRGGRQLAADHDADEAAHVPDRELQSGLGGVPDRHRQPGLFRRASFSSAD